MSSRYFYLYLIIFLEGYVVLATELLAIRQLIPFVGSGTETVAVVISAVLMPLAVGYYFGGKYKTKKIRNGVVTIREKLIRNVLSAAVFLTFGLSYVLLEMLFATFQKIGITHRVLQTSVYSMIFLVAPIFFLGQTVPLISNFFKRESVSRFTGKILFFSTTGSFMGAIISTVVLMGLIGVNNTVIVNVLMLFLLTLLMSKRVFSFNIGVMTILVVLVFFLNNNQLMKKLNIVENNVYSNISVKAENDGGKVIDINRSRSGKYSPDVEKRFEYIQFVEKNFINPLHKKNEKKKILVIGAGGFTVGIDDKLNDYTFVDIDSSLKRISEQYLLPQRSLGETKKFSPQDARAFFYSTQEKYDIIFLDAFTNTYSVPAHLLTVEFFKQVESHLSEGGVMLFNCIASPTFSSEYSIKIDNTLKSVFSNVSRQVIGKLEVWNENMENSNIIYMYFKKNYSSSIYTDDKNTYFLDH